MKFALTLAAVVAARETHVFNYWGQPVKSGVSDVWGSPIDGKDVTGNTYSRNAGSADDYTTDTTSNEHAVATQLTNCESLHSSATGINHCLIGGKCGPCPVKTAFPTPAPTPAPTVDVPHKCVRVGKDGSIVGAVSFGWAGTGADNKYCILEMCQKCKNPTKRAAPYNDQLYCDMTPHSDMSETGNGACGKHQFTDDCEFVSCKFSPSTGLKVTVDQGSRGQGLFPETDKYLTGDQHECRANKDSGAWGCDCKCKTTRPKCTGDHKITGTFRGFRSGKARGCEHTRSYLQDRVSSDCIWESNKLPITHPHGYESMYAQFNIKEIGNMNGNDKVFISVKTCKKDDANDCSPWMTTVSIRDDNGLGNRWKVIKGSSNRGRIANNGNHINTPAAIAEEDGFVQMKVQMRSNSNNREQHFIDNLMLYGHCE